LKNNEEPKDLINKTEEREAKKETKNKKHAFSQIDLSTR
jgi:hypothetical protein